MFWILYKPVIGFMVEDKYPDIISLTPQKIINLGGSPTYVDVGLYVRDIPKLDMVKGDAIAELTVWFLFDPRLVSLDRIGKFTFDRCSIINKSEAYTRIEGEKLLARYDIRAIFSLDLNFKSFPLDDHRVNFILTNDFLAPSEAIFKSSRQKVILNPEIIIPGWKCVDKSVKAGYLLDKIEVGSGEKSIYRSRIIFSFDFARVGFRHIMVIIMPLLLIFIISLLTWTFDPFGRFAPNIIPISVMAITAVIAHHFVIERMSPETGYLMISNYIFLLILFGCCLVFVINIFGQKIMGRYKDIITFLIYALIAGTFITLINPLFNF
jgi:hypothetical protein